MAKQKIHSHFLQIASEKVQLLQQRLDDLKESGANETKSTAGDKHETALAMVQIEQANIRKQLEEALAQKTILEKINPTILTDKIIHGSLVKTNNGYFFVSIALGKASIENITVIALSPQSPLGIKLMGLKVDGQAKVNEQIYIIESVE
ncbi:MAG: hypothetical protein RJA07_1417 [Bacteroidota bacterium]